MTDGNGDKGPGNGPAPRPAGSSQTEDLAERLDQLEARLRSRGRGEPEGPDRSGAASGYARAMKISTEFIAGIVVGGGLGWFIDRGLGTTPWGLIVFLLLGFGAGILNVLRSEGLVAEPRMDGDRGKRSDEDAAKGP